MGSDEKCLQNLGRKTWREGALHTSKMGRKWIRASTCVDYIHVAQVGWSSGLLWQGNRPTSRQFFDQHSEYQLSKNIGISSTIICSYFHSFSLLSSCETYKQMSPLSSKSLLLPYAGRIFLTENRLRSSANMGINWLNFCKESNCE